MDEKQIIYTVSESYDVIAPEYEKNFRNSSNSNKFVDLLDKFLSYLPENAEILDAGVGGGVPTSRYLVEAGMRVTGIDNSQTMLNIAKKNVPELTLKKTDISELDSQFNEENFDGIVSVYTLFHIPRVLHGSIFKQFATILKKGGIMMINTGTSGSDGFSSFFGKPMYWSTYQPKKTLELVKIAGFHILFEGTLIRGGESQYWIIAKKM